MTKIISIVNEKGGVGKTTSTVNIGAALTTLGYKVLLVDLDQQSNLTSYLGCEVRPGNITISELLYFKTANMQVDYKNAVKQSEEGMYVIPSSKMLASITSVLSNISDSQCVLRDILKDKYFDEFDFILLDCRPSLDLLVVNALVASNSVIIPVQAEKFSLDAVYSTMDTISRTRATNPKLKLEGLLLTMVNKRIKMAKAVEESLRETYKDKVFKTIIPRLTEATTSTYEQKSLLSNKKSILGTAYLEVAKEICDTVER